MRLPLAAAMILAASSAPAAEPAAPATLLTVPGKMLWSDALSGPLSADWKVGKGRWEPADGALRGAELAADKHGAVLRRDAAFTDAVITFRFRLDGTKMISLSLIAAKGHVCRVTVRPNGFSVQKDDQDGKNGPDKAQVLQTVATELKPGTWHTLVVEVVGKTLPARLDGELVAVGEHDALAKGKANIGFTVSGETASFSKVSVWEAKPVADFDAARAKLAAAGKAD